MGHRFGPAEDEWLRGNYPEGTINENLEDFEAEFGWRPNKHTLYARAHRLGLRKPLQSPRVRSDGAEVRIAWSKEPEMEAWMLEHDRECVQATVEAFEAEFGIRLSRGQVSLFRASHGTQRRKSSGGRPRRPVGFERTTRGGVLVKVAEEATVPMSKDNWRYKHVLAYEEAYGPVPVGCAVYSIDGDKANCDPANLMAVPKRCCAVLARELAARAAPPSRDEFVAMVLAARLKVAANDREIELPCRCELCGREFAADPRRRAQPSRPRTCPDCLARGLKAGGRRRKRKDIERSDGK